MALIAAILSSRIPGCSALAAVLCVVPSSSYLVPTSFKRPRGSIQFDTSTLGSADTRSQDVTNSVSRRSRLRILLAPGGTEGCCACMKFGQQMPVRPHSASLIATSRCLLHRCTAAADCVACTGAVLIVERCSLAGGCICQSPNTTRSRAAMGSRTSKDCLPHI